MTLILVLADVMYEMALFLLTFPRRQILDSFKLKEFADDNFKFDENGRKFSRRVENTVGKGEIAHYKLVMSNFSFSLTVFKRLVLQTHENQGLTGKGLTVTRS